MKLHAPHTHRSLRRNERGMAVIAVIGLIAILLIYVAGNARTLHLLGKEIKLHETRQVRRLATLSATNAPAIPPAAANPALPNGHPAQ